MGLRRRPVQAALPVQYVGKEGNKLDDRVSGLVMSTNEYRNEYVDQDGEWRRVILPALASMERRTLIEKSGLHRRTIERYIYKGVVPRPAHWEAFNRIVAEDCRQLS
jgi:hypothetical protein